jgi:threonine/homoserine/homoserine lactone efflux protein
MLGTHSLALFATTVFVVKATPGVDMMLTLTQTLRHGVRGGLAAAAGIMAGCVVHALAAALGLAALIAASAAAFSVLKWLGAAYLLWLAFGMLKSALAGGAAAAPAPQLAASPGRAALFRQGVLTNVLNPKIALFFLALLPQFIDADAPSKTLAFLFLGAWFVVQGGLFLFAFVLLVAPLRRWQAGGIWKRGLNAAGAGLFTWLAARLAFAERA